MSKNKKIETFVEAIERLILDGAPGFTEKLPGQREIATRFNLSQSSVHIGLAELEKRGLIQNLPCRGALVTLDERKHKRRSAGEVLNLAVCEDMVHQRDFWMDAVRNFEAQNPGVTLKVRFFPGSTELEKLPQGEGNQIVIRPGDYRQTALPLVPLRELLDDDTIRLLRKNYLAGLPAPDWSVALPYQLQTPSLIYDSKAANTAPPETDIMLYLEWAAENLGAKSLPVPDLNFLRDCCGLERVSMFTARKSGISNELKYFLETLETMARLRLINPNCGSSKDYFPYLKSGEVKCVEVFSHFWGAAAPGMPPEFRFAPPPQAGRTIVSFFLSSAILIGNRSVSEAEKAWFHSLVSTRFQEKMLRRGMGLSPYCNILSAYRPEEGGPDLRRITGWVKDATFIDNTDPCFDRAWFDVVARLRTPVIVPLLLGRMNAAEAEELIVSRQLLAESYMENALAENLYAFCGKA